MLEIRGFITNLGKYNEGELIGKWITFPLDEDELNEVLKDIGCTYYNEDGERLNPFYEEYFFTDWDNDINCGFGEYENIDFLNTVAEDLEAWDEDTLKAACEVWSLPEVLSNCPDDYTLYPDIETDYDLGYYWVNDSGCYDLSKMGTLANYIDYEAFGRDIRIETNGGFTSNGWVEYVG